MGNTQGKKPESPQQLGKFLDEIAAKYILTENFQDLVNLEKKTYCDKLVIITSKIFNKFLNQKDVKYLEQRMERGVPVDKMDSAKLVYFQKNNLEKLDVQSSLRKKRMCIGIARFYIKIAHIWAAILSTLNPEWTYVDSMGKTERVNFRQGVPKIYRATMKHDIQNNFCGRRIKMLTPTSKGASAGKKRIRVCRKAEENTDFKLAHDTGIPELEYLYYDKYDFGTGAFTKMTTESKKQYQKDVAIFYKAFTGQSQVPANITSFSQIALADYSNKAVCNANGSLRSEFNYDKTQKPFVQYANHLANMMKNAETNRNKLINILNKIFKKEFNSSTRTTYYTIQPKLTTAKLQAIIVETRNLIIQLYTQCENDFRLGIKLFEALVEKLQQTQNINRNTNVTQQLQQLQQ